MGLCQLWVVGPLVGYFTSLKALPGLRETRRGHWSQCLRFTPSRSPGTECAK